MISFKIAVSAAIVAATVGFGLTFSSANASLIGDQVDGTLKFDGNPTTNFFDVASGSAAVTETVVDPGVEFTTHFSGDALLITADLDGDSLWIDVENNFGSQLSFPEFVITLEDLDWVGMAGEITDVVAVFGNTLVETNLAFGPHSIELTFGPFTLNDGEFISAHYDLITNHTVVPEPGTLLLIGTMSGFAAVAARRKKAQKSAVQS